MPINPKSAYFAQHQAQRFVLACAKRHPDPQLASALADSIGNHAVQPHRGQDKPQQAERAHQFRGHLIILRGVADNSFSVVMVSGSKRESTDFRTRRAV